MANKPKVIASTDALPPEPIDPAAVSPSALLQAAKLRQQKELDDLQTQIDTLSEEFATRAAAIVEAGLSHSYQLARQKIGAIDLSFFGSGEELSPPIDIPALASSEV
jgi:hypothetical protein